MEHDWSMCQSSNIWNVFWIYQVHILSSECRRKVVSARIACAIKSLINVMGLQLECARVLQNSLLVPVLLYDSEVKHVKRKGKVLGLGLCRYSAS